MMFRRAGKTSGIARVAAWMAAYVLVLQAVLASAAMAAMPRSGVALELCLNSAGDADDAGKGLPPGVHCPACLARADVAGLPPPVATPLLDRIAIELEFRAVVRAALRPAGHRLPLQPRAPPAVA